MGKIKRASFSPWVSTTTTKSFQQHDHQATHTTPHQTILTPERNKLVCRNQSKCLVGPLFRVKHWSVSEYYSLSHQTIKNNSTEATKRPCKKLPDVRERAHLSHTFELIRTRLQSHTSLSQSHILSNPSHIIAPIRTLQRIWCDFCSKNVRKMCEKCSKECDRDHW